MPKFSLLSLAANARIRSPASTNELNSWWIKVQWGRDFFSRAFGFLCYRSTPTFHSLIVEAKRTQQMNTSLRNTPCIISSIQTHLMLLTKNLWYVIICVYTLKQVKFCYWSGKQSWICKIIAIACRSHRKNEQDIDVNKIYYSSLS
jgi:hypothetical protein